MADRPFDRTIINVRERPLSTDINQAQSQLDRSARELYQNLFAQRASDFSEAPLAVSGFLGYGFKVTPSASPDLDVTVQAGLGFHDDGTFPSAIGGIIGLDDLNTYKPISLLTNQTFTIAPDATFPRIDIIEVKNLRRAENPLSRDILDPGTGAFSPASVNKTLAFNLDGEIGIVADPAASTEAISYKTGTPAAVPVAPAATAGYIPVAQIRVAAGATTIDSDVIIDKRKLLLPYGQGFISAKVSKPTGTGIPTLSNVIAPPGVIVSASRGSFGASTGCVIFALIPSPSTLKFRFQGNTFGDQVSGSQVNLLNYAGPTGGGSGAFISSTLTATEKGWLANAALTSPIVKAAEGQQRLVVAMQGVIGDNTSLPGAVFAVSADNPTEYFVNFSFGY